MNILQSRINDVRARLQRQWLWQCLSWGLVGGGMGGCLVGLVRTFVGDSIPWAAITVPVLAGPVIGLMYYLFRPRRLREAAVSIDRQCGLKDRITTAMSFLENPQRSTPIHELQIDDAMSHAAQVDPVQVVPVTTPRTWRWGLGLTAAALALALWTAPRHVAIATVVANDVVTAQADRLASELTELEHFNEQEVDPEVQQMIQELAAKIEELKQPGIDPKEALAKLSEMEAVLQEKQQQLSLENTEAALAQLGEALALAEPFAAAGQAMSQGQLEKASEELAKLELPKLDRQTERTLAEKLAQQAQQNDGSGMPRSLRDSIEQVSEGMTQGNRGKFREGIEGLAGECQKQGRRKKLVDLLRKQCQCLGECKGECENECQNIADSNKKGGKQWGLGRSDNQPGDPTAQWKTGQQLQLTGQDSGSGDADIETVRDDEQEQGAVRRYREQLQKYEQLAESALESEPIPLGHRQTIRRYFEMIRPQTAETDAVIERTSD